MCVISKKNPTNVILLFLLLIISVVLVGCSTEPTDTINAEKQTDINEEDHNDTGNKSLVLHLAGGDTGLPNPFRHTVRGPGMSKMQILYDSLLEKDEKGIIPWLAQDWDVSDDGTVYTFYLRKNAMWHDGTPLTAEDVAFTLNYYKVHPPVSNELIVAGEYIVTDTEVKDSQTIEITLNKFDNTYLTKLGGVRILPMHIWEDITDPAGYTGEDATVGSGPYKLDYYDPQQGIYRYVAFDEYWGFEPAAAAIEWIPVSDSVLAFQNNEIDLINASADILSMYMNDSDYEIKTAHSYHSYRLMMNMETVTELQDINLRRAIAYGINREDLVDKAARGAAAVSSQGYILPQSPWYNEKIEQYDYNPEKAVELLEGKKYSFKLLTDNSNDGIKVAELIKLNLADIGIEVTVESVESKIRDNAVKTGEYQLLLINSGGLGGDPDYIRTVYGKSTSTIKGWSNSEIEELVEAQASEKDEAIRKEMINKIQELIAQEVPMIMLHGAVDNYVFRKAYYDGWMFRYDHSKCDHNKLSYLIRN